MIVPQFIFFLSNMERGIISNPWIILSSKMSPFFSRIKCFENLGCSHKPSWFCTSSTYSKGEDHCQEQHWCCYLGFVLTHHLLKRIFHAVIALKILFTVSVTVASAEGSSSHLKLIKTYLRLTMSWKHLSDLAKISIKCDVAVLLCYIDLINDLAAVNARKVGF